MWLLRRRRRYRVEGASMEPLLHSGDEVLIAPHASIDVGDIVVARHPYRDDVILIKYIDHFDAKGQAHLLGTHLAESTDSRSQGNVPSSRILGKVMSRFPPLPSSH